MRNKQKNKIIITLTGILLLIITVYLIIQEKDEPKTIAPETLLGDVQYINKQLAVSLYENNQERTNELVANANIVWNDYIDAIDMDQQLSKEKQKQVIKITEYFQKADELIKENNIEEAINEIKKARLEIGEFTGQINQKMQEDLFLMYLEVEKIRHAPLKADVGITLDDLKLRFTALKAYSIDEEYIILLEKLEKTISILDKSFDGPDFQKARADLDAVFMGMYNKY